MTRKKCLGISDRVDPLILHWDRVSLVERLSYLRANLKQMVHFIRDSTVHKCESISYDSNPMQCNDQRVGGA